MQLRPGMTSVFRPRPSGRHRRIAVTTLHGMIARAAMAPAPPMQREAVGGAVITILPIRAVLTMRTVAALPLLRRLLVLLAAGDE